MLSRTKAKVIAYKPINKRYTPKYAYSSVIFAAFDINRFLQVQATISFCRKYVLNRTYL